MTNKIYTHYLSIKKQFEEKFPRLWLHNGNIPVETYLQSALVSQLEEVERVVEGMKGFAKKELVEKLSEGARTRVEHRDIGYNQALSDLLLTLRKEWEKELKNN